MPDEFVSGIERYLEEEGAGATYAIQTPQEPAGWR
jgi:hypothetical protein